MFICEVGALVTLLYALADTFVHRRAVGFDLAISLWLWFTVLFANFAEAMAEGRGKAQADFLRRTKTETTAQRIAGDRDPNRQRLASCARATASSSRPAI